MTGKPDDDAATEPEHDRPAQPDVRRGPYPGALDERLLTPRAPLPPGAGITVFPPIMDPTMGSGVPAAWAPDPAGRHQWRWWNGMRWTDHVADDGEVSEDPLTVDP